jgi:DNA-binding Lrp family transcriptional regulator
MSEPLAARPPHTPVPAPIPVPRGALVQGDPMSKEVRSAVERALRQRVEAAVVKELLPTGDLPEDLQERAVVMSALARRRNALCGLVHTLVWSCDERGQVWARQEVLAERAGKSTRTVARLLRQLEGYGLVARHGVSVNGRGLQIAGGPSASGGWRRPSIYQLQLHALPSVPSAAGAVVDATPVTSAPAISTASTTPLELKHGDVPFLEDASTSRHLQSTSTVSADGRTAQTGASDVTCPVLMTGHIKGDTNSTAVGDVPTAASMQSEAGQRRQHSMTGQEQVSRSDTCNLWRDGDGGGAGAVCISEASATDSRDQLRTTAPTGLETATDSRDQLRNSVDQTRADLERTIRNRLLVEVPELKDHAVTECAALMSRHPRDPIGKLNQILGKSRDPKIRNRAGWIVRAIRSEAVRPSDPSAASATLPAVAGAMAASAYGSEWRLGSGDEVAANIDRLERERLDLFMRLTGQEVAA